MPHFNKLKQLNRAFNIFNINICKHAEKKK
jgi:hypothetical protein